MRISDWSSDVCSSDLVAPGGFIKAKVGDALGQFLALDPVIDALGHRQLLQLPAQVLDQARVQACGGRTTLEQRLQMLARSEERRVGKECVSTCRSRWWPCH